ncbi:MAG: type II toxin-antitoxin system Phd/YefM family antitoxin [Bdellovibrionota bacterium]
MHTIVNIHQAKTQLSKLLEEVKEGHEVIIAKFGHPIAKLVPFTEVKTPLKIGLMKGKVEVQEDFDAPLSEDVIKLFYEENS